MTPAPPAALDIDFQTPLGRLRGRLGVPPGPIRLAELAYNVLALDDQLVRMSVAAVEREGKGVSCRKGCGACCRQVVPVSPAEAWLLADLVRSFPPARQAHVVARFAEANGRLRGSAFASAYGGRRYDVFASSMDAFLEMGLEYLRLGVPCPFLEDESCSIYAARPTVCREFLVTSPAAYCADPGRLPVESVPKAVSLTECLSKVSALVTGGEPQAIPLTLALDWAEAHRELGQRRYDAASLMVAFLRLLAPDDAPPGAAPTDTAGPASA